MAGVALHRRKGQVFLLAALLFSVIAFAFAAAKTPGVSRVEGNPLAGKYFDQLQEEIPYGVNTIIASARNDTEMHRRLQVLFTTYRVILSDKAVDANTVAVLFSPTGNNTHSAVTAYLANFQHAAMENVQLGIDADNKTIQTLPDKQVKRFTFNDTAKTYTAVLRYTGETRKTVKWQGSWQNHVLLLDLTVGDKFSTVKDTEVRQGRLISATASYSTPSAFHDPPDWSKMSDTVEDVCGNDRECESGDEITFSTRWTDSDSVDSCELWWNNSQRVTRARTGSPIWCNVTESHILEEDATETFEWWQKAENVDGETNETDRSEEFTYTCPLDHCGNGVCDCGETTLCEDCS